LKTLVESVTLRQIDTLNRERFFERRVMTFKRKGFLNWMAGMKAYYQKQDSQCLVEAGFRSSSLITASA
jgi:hypothetical protein